MAIGEFNRRVQIKMNPTKVQDGSGNVTISGYGTTLNTWAKVIDHGGNRVFDATSKDRLFKRKSFEVFYRTDIADNLDVDTLIVYDGREYQVDDTTIVKEVKRIIKVDAVTED